MKVVFHVNESSKWPTAIGNINNLIKTGVRIQAIEVVANGEAVKGYLEASLGIGLHELAEKKVKLTACQNAMAHFDVKEEDLPPFITIIPAGVLRLIECQTNSYAYIKP